jgi:hypothetical protein
MSILGSISQIYMFVLLILLFIGSGFALWSFINFVMNSKGQKDGAFEKKGVASQEVRVRENNKIITKIYGGIFMNNNGWLKLAVFSFVGILASVVVLGLISTSNSAGANIHQQHQPQGMQQGIGNNMNMQSGMSGNMGMQMNGGMMQNNDMMIQQQLNQMQMQLNQMQQQMGMMNGGMGGMNNMGSMQQGGMNNMGSMQQGGMSNMGGMGMMNGMMGGMGMMNMGGMSSMPQNNGSSSGSMAGMGMM